LSSPQDILILPFAIGFDLDYNYTRMKQKNINLREARQGTAADTANGDDSFYESIIHQHWPYIEKQCFKAVRLRLQKIAWTNPGTNLDIAVENEALELSNRLLDTLKAGHYRVLRQFKRNAKLSTYFTTIIARQAVDLIREKRGRSREKERAREFGPLGERIYEMMARQGFSAGEIYRNLKSNNGVATSLQEVEQVIDRIKGKGTRNPGEAEDLTVPDSHSNPETILIEQQQRAKIDEAVGRLIGQLKGEERLILRMRFPTAEGQAPMKAKAIARTLNISEKAVYKRIDRILQRCRDILNNEGLGRHDLL
jgi:RNA polymerase sigma factor (sigma-70 family)